LLLSVQVALSTPLMKLSVRPRSSTLLASLALNSVPPTVVCAGAGLADAFEASRAVRVLRILVLWERLKLVMEHLRPVRRCVAMCTAPRYRCMGCRGLDAVMLCTVALYRLFAAGRPPHLALRSDVPVLHPLLHDGMAVAASRPDKPR
jgi:hypothetical protein